MYSCLLGWLSKSFWRRLLRYICLTPTKPICRLYCNYTELLSPFLEGSALSGVISSMNKASMLKPSVTMDSDFMLAQPLMDSYVYPISFSSFGSTCDMVFRNFPNVLHAGIAFPGLITSRNQLSNKFTMVGFDPGFQGWKMNVLTTWLCTWSFSVIMMSIPAFPEFISCHAQY